MYLSKEQIINQAFRFHSQGNISEAAKYYQYFINQGFKDHRVFSNYGIILKNLGKFKEAEELYRKAIAIKPDFADAFYNLGNILNDIGKLQDAELSYRKAIELNPKFENAYCNLGGILKDLGKLQDAELSYRKAIELNPSFAEVHSNLGTILKDLGKLQEAELSYRKAIELNPSFAEVHSNLGSILKDLGKLQDAELSYRKAIELNPSFAEAHSNLGGILKDLGKLQDAELSYRKAIELKPDYSNAHYNLGIILNDLSKLQEAEVSTRKAIQLKPDFADAHNNLGAILTDIGRLQEAEISLCKAIQLNPNLAESYLNLGSVLSELGNLKGAEISLRKAIQLNPNLAESYYALSRINCSDEDKTWQDLIFSENILFKKSKKEQVSIYFTRANILHKEKNYKESSKCLKLANKLKLAITPSNIDYLIDKSKALLIESNKKSINKKVYKNYCESIFIVGIPRSGSTLVESILSMSNDVYDLGEINFLEESYKEYEKSKEDLNLAEIYLKKVNPKKNVKITTNKNLYNYQYTGIIASQIPNAKIIHCVRNPLDNILSIYRANFKKGNEYSSSLVDCARIYLDQEKVMTKYKNKFPSKIYDLKYDQLVTNPNQEIKSLIKWLGWEWDDSYLSPHLNTRSVSTASNIQVRSPINSRSIGGWKNYKEMLRPAIAIITQNDKYKNFVL